MRMRQKNKITDSLSRVLGVIVVFLFVINAFVYGIYRASEYFTSDRVPALPGWQRIYRFYRIHPKTVVVYPEADCSYLVPARENGLKDEYKEAFELLLAECIFDKAGLKIYGREFHEYDVEILANSGWFNFRYRIKGKSHSHLNTLSVHFTQRDKFNRSENGVQDYSEYQFNEVTIDIYGKRRPDNWKCKSNYERCMFDDNYINESIFWYLDNKFR